MLDENIEYPQVLLFKLIFVWANVFTEYLKRNLSEIFKTAPDTYTKAVCILLYFTATLDYGYLQ